MKTWSVVIFFVVVAGIVWKYSADDSDIESSAEGAPNTEAVAAGDSKGSEGVTSDSEADGAADDSSGENSSQFADTTTEQLDNTAQNASPFSVVDETTAETLPSVDSATEQLEAAARANSDQTVTDDGASSRLLEPVEVPNSYPVTDAAKYFIPKEERGPGRLGGPPPLDFPGGPSDPNRESGTVFQPPTSPSQ